MSYKSRQQTCAALSTYSINSIANATREVIKIRHLVGELLNATVGETTSTREDNQRTIAYSQNAMVSKKTKLIDIKFHFVKDNVGRGTFRLKY
jgi:hypothetical protein